METIIKLNSKTSEEVKNHLLEFPYYTLKCRLGKVLKERGIKIHELSKLTGIRVATISEMANMKRTTLNIPHLVLIAQTLRIVDISELFEIVMPEDTYEIFAADLKKIDGHGLLPEQNEKLDKLKESRGK